jgi:sugar phosphate isomerase/epimerase
LKFSISSLAWKREEDEEVRELLIAQNVYNIDIIPLHVVKTLTTNIEDVRNYKKFWADYKIEILGMQSLFYEKKDSLFFSSENSIKESLSYFVKVSDLACKLGCSSLIFGSPKQRNLSIDFVSNESIQMFFKEMSKICKRHNQTICIEPNSKLYGTNFLTSTREVAEFVSLLDIDNVRMNFDTGCDIMNNEDPISSFEEFGHLAHHIHISAPNLKCVDDAIMDHKGFSKILKKSNYAGGVSIEMLRNEKKSIENIRNALNVFKKNY